MLADYLRIPCLSPAFEESWKDKGYISQAIELLRSWAEATLGARARVWVSEVPGRTPALVVDVEASLGRDPGPVCLIYGHLDKQPPLGDWGEGLGPFAPVGRADRLFGRGAADDGYAIFAAIGAIEAAAAGEGHQRCIVLIEASEESGSPDLSAHLDALAGDLENCDLVVCLDSGCISYDRLWATTSLRGLISGTLEVGVLHSGVHSGTAGGVVPSSFRIARALLDRLEDPGTGDVRLGELRGTVPNEVVEAAAATAAVWSPFSDLAVLQGVELEGNSEEDRLLRRNWGPALEVVGADGIPQAATAGNVLRPFTKLKLAIRLPPGVDSDLASDAVARALTGDPPHGATVRWELEAAASGWVAPRPPQWLSAAVDQASMAAFGNPAGEMGEGGSIPFLHMLTERLPQAAMLVTGVLGPDSNAHGVDESLHVPTAQRLTAALSVVLESHGTATK